MNIFKSPVGNVGILDVTEGIFLKVKKELLAPEGNMGEPFNMTAKEFATKFLESDAPPLNGWWVNGTVAKGKARKFLSIIPLRTGRPLYGNTPRVRFGTTVYAETLEIIGKAQEPGESIGQVLDRWAIKFKS